MTDSKSLGTVLVIGGCGFVGSAVVDQLLNFPSENSTPTLSPSEPRQLKRRADGSLSVTIDRDTPLPSLRSRYPAYTNTKVHALDLRCVRNRYEGCTYHDCDITSSSQLIKVFDEVRPDIVINTASPSFEAPHDILRKVNVDGTKTLLGVAASRCKVFVHTSSSSVVHDAESDLIDADERYPYVCPNPREYYSETKVYAEKMVLEANAGDGGGMLTCAVRPAGIVGEGDRGGFGYGITKTASESPGWMLHLQLGDGMNMFDCTYVGNVAYGLLCAAEALREVWKRRRDGKGDVLDFEKVDGEAFNVTNDEPACFWDLGRFLYTRYGRVVERGSVWELPREMCLAMGAGAELFSWVSGRKGKMTRQTVKYSTMNRWFSCEKLKNRCGYEPKVGVEEGLERTVRWFKDVVEQDEGKKIQ